MATNGDSKAHEQTYSGFTALMKWGAIAAFAAGMLVVLLIAN